MNDDTDQQPIRDFGRRLVEFGRFKRERAKSFLEAGLLTGEDIGKAVGWLVALVILAAFHILIWSFTALYFVSVLLLVALYYVTILAIVVLRGILVLGFEICETFKIDSRKRRTIPREVRLAIAKDQDWKCYYGGAPMGKRSFHIDHLKPVSKGGSNERSNLVACCRKHNLQKSDKDLHEFLDWMEENRQTNCRTRPRKPAVW